MTKEDKTTRPVTMQDIARAAGVSQSTVSRVLNDSPTSVPIAAETRERVREVAQRLGYRPNPLARGLRGARTMLLGVIVREITDPFFSMAIDAISTEALARGYNVVLGSAHSRADEAIALRAVLETRHCDAILLLGDMRDEPKFLEDLRASQTPVVALWHGTELEGVPTVNVDNRAGIEATMAHLAELGHRGIAFIGGRPLGDIRERCTAYLDYMTGAGLDVPDEYVHNVTNDPGGGDSALRAIMEVADPPTAIVCSSDHLATGVLHAASDLGLNVPGDLSVVGFDDIPMASFTVPALTTVRMPVAEMSAEAARLAIDDPDGDGDGLQDYVAVPHLVVRESTGEAPAR